MIAKFEMSSSSICFETDFDMAKAAKRYLPQSIKKKAAKLSDLEGSRQTFLEILWLFD